MKEIWICRWEAIPGDGEHTEQFPTLAAAKQAMRQKICQYVDLREYLSDLEPPAAEFLGKYLSDPQFPHCEQDVPEDYEDPEHGTLLLDPAFICWDHPYDAYPRLNSNMVLEDIDYEDNTFNFWYEHPEKADGNGVRELTIRIYSYIDYGTAAYPLMILRVLDNEPKTQQKIIREVYELYDKKIERKAVRRNLDLLDALGFRVKKCKDGYYIDDKYNR